MKCDTCEGTGRIVEGGTWKVCPDCSVDGPDGNPVGTGERLVGGDDATGTGRGRKPKASDNPPPTPGGGVGKDR